jgi:hypothetical protein
VSAVAEQAGVLPDEDNLPPTIELGAVSLALVAVGVIFVAAHLPKQAPFTLPITTLAIAASVFGANVILVARIRPFARPVFLRVFGWATLGYAVIAGMLEYVFILDNTRGSALVLMTLNLVVFTVNIPLVLAFGVARYQPVDAR